MIWNALVDPALSGRLCLMLLHSVWQVALLALLAWCIDRLWRNRSVERRYAVNVAALVASLVAMPITYLLIDVAERPNDALSVTPTVVAAAESGPTSIRTSSVKAELDVENQTINPRLMEDDQTTTSSASASLPAAAPTVTPSPRWLALAPWIVVFYAAGVVLMLARLVVAVISANRLGHHADLVTEGPLVETLRSLARGWSMRVVPALARAEQIVVPTVVGLVRPTILLPAAAISGLSTDELEMILAHELAHVRRYDMWVNLVQRLAEAALFFNPALWYLSRRVSTLREYCCDEMTCRTQSTSAPEPRVRYATALLRVVELAKPNPATASDLATLAASGRSPSELRRRVARLFGEPVREPVRLTRGSLLAFASVAVLLTCGPALWPTGAQTADIETETKPKSDDANANATKKFTFGGRVELLALGTHGESPQGWWDVLGKPIEPVPFTWKKDGTVTSTDDSWRRIVFRIDNLPDDAGVKWKILRPRASAGGEVTVNGQRRPKGYFTRYFSAGKDQETVGLRIGVATGPWRTAAKSMSPKAVSGSGNKSIIFSGALGTAEGTVVVVSHNFFDQDFRVVAVDKQGKDHASVYRGGVSAGKIYQTRATFPKVTPDDIDRIEFQTRDYEWIEFNRLPLNPGAPNILKFPTDRMAGGVVFSRPAEFSGFGAGDDWYGGWQQIGPARGKVTVPVGHFVRLDVSKEASTDLSFMSAIGPDAIQYLSLNGTDVNDEQLRYVGRLTGLRFLDLEQTRITDRGFRNLADLKNVKRLDLSAFGVHREGFGVGDGAMAVVAQLPVLESITLRHTKVTDAGMAELAKCRSLRAISIAGTSVTDAGLKFLRDMPNLHFLGLGAYEDGADITDEGMKTLGQMFQLRHLSLSGTPITDDGLSHLSALTQLESLDIDHTEVTNAGLRHLAALSSLKQIRASDLADGYITDDGAKHLARVPSLVRIVGSLAVTDEGVAELARLSKLESLRLHGHNGRITNKSIQRLTAMTRLKDLSLSDCNISSEALVHLAELKHLEDLSISRRGLDTKGLEVLQAIASLRFLRLGFGELEDRPSGLKPNLKPLAAMKQLTYLSIGGEGIDLSDLESISKLTRLETLNFGRHVVLDDKSIGHLAKLRSLKHLEIDSSVVTDKGLLALANIDKLQYLRISCLATDEGLASLHGLSSLRLLQISSPHVTDAGLTAFTKAMPSLQKLSHGTYRLKGVAVPPPTKDAVSRQDKPDEQPAKEASEDKPATESPDSRLNEQDKPKEYTTPVTVFGKALDDQGHPIVGAEIFLASLRPGYRRLTETKTDENGSYRFD